MHLLHTKSLELQEFIGDDIPKYAILSHTWGDGEVLFRHVWEKKFPSNASAGSSKIRNACAQAVKDGWEYIWVDTCCINKESSAELSEAINSMYQWYRASEVCYVYLSDVSPSAKELRQSRWFTRGWTLQELLAPRLVIFFDQNWQYLACKDLDDLRLTYGGLSPDFSEEEDPKKEGSSRVIDFLYDLAEATGVGVDYLIDASGASIAQKMSWVARRQTKRGEDTAYCMLGLFDVNMPLLYGEGKTKAFFRLQSEILKSSSDNSIFAWNNPDLWSSGLLAHSPHDFSNCGNIRSRGYFGARRPPSLTRLGVEMDLPLVDAQGDPVQFDRNYAVYLNCCGAENRLFVLHIHFFRQDFGILSEHVKEHSPIVARRTNAASNRGETSEYPILHGGRKGQVYFPQIARPKSSAWRILKVGPIPWNSVNKNRPAFVPPAISFKLGDALFQYQGINKLEAIQFYQDLSNHQKSPQRIEIPLEGAKVAMSQDRTETPCGLLLSLPSVFVHLFSEVVGYFDLCGYILLRWCPDDDRTSSIEVLHLEYFNTYKVNTKTRIRSLSKDLENLMAGGSVESNRGALIAQIKSRDLLRRADVLAYALNHSSSRMRTLRISLLDDQDHGDGAEWIIEIDETSE